MKQMSPECRSRTSTPTRLLTDDFISGLAAEYERLEGKGCEYT